MPRRSDGTISYGRELIDVDALISHLKAEDKLDAPLPGELRVGHVPLHVRKVREAMDVSPVIMGFYVMGVSETFKATFVSAGGYPHHVGLNAWQREGAPSPLVGVVGLRNFTIDLSNELALGKVFKRVDDAGISPTKTVEGLLVQDPSQYGLTLLVI